MSNSHAVHHIKVTTFEVRVPFTEEKSEAEYLFNVLYQTSYASIGASFYIGMETMMEIFSNIITIVPKLTEYKLKNMIDKFTKNNITKQQLNFALKDVAKLSIDTDKYKMLFLFLKTMSRNWIFLI